MRSGADPISLRTHFERLPASVKGAFVLRGADGNPHGVSFLEAAVARVPTGPTRPIRVEDHMLDVAPNRDLFVPFEAMLSDLLPAWYAVRTVVRVDGGRPQEFISRAFALEWPRSEIRRGSVQLDAAARAGGHSYLVERVELGADAATVFWRPQQTGGRGSASSRVGAEERAPAGTDEASGTDALTGGAAALLVADGQELETVPAHVAPPSRLHRPGEARTVSYPVARGVRSLAVVVRSGSGESSTPVDVPLP